jgi:U3 small nucleolar ribonucleoprotein protein LCP5
LCADCLLSSNRRAETDELDYAAGISLLSLKNHLLLSYLQHLVALFSLKLSSKSLVQSEPAARVVAHLVKLRVVLEKVAPLELKLKYQVEKLVRKADQFDDQGGAQNEEDVLNGQSTHALPSAS